jgi:CBS-domain-containing membrane protein
MDLPPTASPHIFDQRLSSSVVPDAGFKLLLNPNAVWGTFQQLFMFLSKYPAKDEYPRHTTGTMALEKDSTGKCIIIRKNALVRDVFKLFATEGISGAPVLDSHDKYCGFVDLLDLVSYVTKLFCWDTRTRTAADFSTFFEKNRRFATALVSDFGILDRVGKPRVLTLHENSSLLHVLETILDERQRRVPLMNTWGQLSGIITSSMLISTIGQNLEFLAEAGDIQVTSFYDELNYWVDSCRDTDEAHSAFEKMVSTNRTGLPVLNQSGVLVDTLSMRDLRGIGTNAERFRQLWSTVTDFKAQTRINYPLQTPWRPIVCTRESTIRDVLRLMCDGDIHRVFVVGDIANPIPLRVVSQRDLLKVLLRTYRQTPAPLKPTVTSQ